MTVFMFLVAKDVQNSLTNSAWGVGLGLFLTQHMCLEICQMMIVVGSFKDEVEGNKASQSGTNDPPQFRTHILASA